MDCAPDCCTFIYYAKAGLLDILENTFETIIVTDTIQQEILEGKKESKLGAFLLEKKFQQKKKYHLISISKKDLKEETAYFKGLGEASLAVLNKTHKSIIITSDITATKKFVRRGMTNIIRSDELLLLAFQQKQYDRASLLKKLVQLKTVGGTTEQRLAFLQSQISEDTP